MAMKLVPIACPGTPTGVGPDGPLRTTGVPRIPVTATETDPDGAVEGKGGPETEMARPMNASLEMEARRAAEGCGERTAEGAAARPSTLPRYATPDTATPTTKAVVTTEFIGGVR